MGIFTEGDYVEVDLPVAKDYAQTVTVDIAPLPVKIPDPAFELLGRWHEDILKSYGGCP